MTRLLGWVGAAAIGLSQAAVLPAQASQSMAPLAAPLPSTKLEFGLSNLDSTWMTSSGVPWRYRFQYLAGGVNTTGNWLTWQDPAKPPGQFALDYMTGSSTPPGAYIPVFTWYQLLQSLPSTGSTELDRDYSNLNNAATMSSYYSSFKILMQKAGAYGGQVVVHVEPDFWGYMQQKAAGGGATAIPAMVRSSGFAEASSFADNLIGFASELRYLRDTYAPNALLATHASMWSSGIDIATNTSASVNAVGEADKTAAFLNSAGAGSWDAVFNDVDDHNAAWWELASCGTPPCVNQWFTHWWDPSNVRFPNFARYLSWVGQLHSRTAKPQVVWQVPMGNQYFLTMSNTCRHYQDNVAPYFIQHATDLFSAGLIAVLFGPGNTCQTTYDDPEPPDGITNNSGVPTTDLLGGCSACNTNASVWPDDDGGYLRIFVGRYYSGQTPCVSVGVSAAPGRSSMVGTAVTISGAAAGCPNPLYRFWILNPGSGVWQLAQDYSSGPSFNWNTSGKPAGTYRFSVWARDASGPGVYTNSLGSYDAWNAAQHYTLTLGCSALGVSAAPSSPSMVGTAVTISGAAAGCLNASPLYQFWILNPGSGVWRLAQDYSSSPSLSWSTNGKPAGTYRFSVWVKNSSGAGVYSNSLGSYDAFNVSQYYTLTPGCSTVGVSASPASPRPVGTAVTITGAASGCLSGSPLYQFWILYPGSGVWRLAQDYSPSAGFNWNSTGLPRGTYRFSVWVKNSSGAGAYSNSLGTYDAFNASRYFTLQ